MSRPTQTKKMSFSTRKFTQPPRDWFPPTPPSTRNTIRPPLHGLPFFAHFLQHGQGGKVTILLLIVQSVSDHELVGDIEPHIVHHHLDLPAGRLTKHGAYLDLLRLLCAEFFSNGLDGSAGVHRILEQLQV